MGAGCLPVEYTNPSRTRFDWLNDPAERSAALRHVEQPLARGWLDPATDDVEPLKATLAEILEDPAATAGQKRRVNRLLERLGAAAGNPAAVR
jgi:hypothetical protein